MMIADILQHMVEIDTDLFFLINGVHNNSFFDSFMSTYSGKWVWVPMYAAILYVMLQNFSWKVTLLCILGVTLTITFADQACATWIRPCVERLRPSNPNNPISSLVHIVDGRRGGAYGFPSCHAANTFALAYYLFLLFRHTWLTVFMAGWALLTCYSRVYLGVHYPGDLLAGAIVGIIGASLIYCLFARVADYRRPKPVKHVLAPVLIGCVTIICMLGVSAFY